MVKVRLTKTVIWKGAGYIPGEIITVSLKVAKEMEREGTGIIIKKRWFG